MATSGEEHAEEEEGEEGQVEVHEIQDDADEVCASLLSLHVRSWLLRALYALRRSSCATVGDARAHVSH